MSEDEIYQQILEWDSTKTALMRIEAEPNNPIHGAFPGHQLLVNAKFARALRLIMESLETKPNRKIIEEVLEELKRK